MILNYSRPVLIEARDPRDPVVVQLGLEQQHELAALEGDGHISYALHDGIEFVAGFVDGRPVACGALQPLGDGVGELKRMYVRPLYRRQGLSRLILAALEELAMQRGYHTLRLETGGFLVPAVGLYQGAGYRSIPLFGEYVGNPRSVCFEKSLLAVEVP
jgi:ribosomal protein S18 acetylase RimI-like enzyme